VIGARRVRRHSYRPYVEATAEGRVRDRTQQTIWLVGHHQ
jgi:hypothetical protein